MTNEYLFGFFLSAFGTFVSIVWVVVDIRRRAHKDNLEVLELIREAKERKENPAAPQHHESNS